MRVTLILSLALIALSSATPASAQSGTRSPARQASRAPQVSRTPQQSNGFALVELYTSEGCSSCPPADRLLAQVNAHAQKNQLPVYVLGFHVDYWNYLGWPDRFSSEEISKRQRSYAQHWNSRRVYTPQAIVNGSVEFNGSSNTKMAQAIDTALKHNADQRLQISAKRNGNQITVAYKIDGNRSNARLNIAVVQTLASTDVKRGENANRSLAHVNVVRSLKYVDAQANGQVTCELPDEVAPEKLKVIGFVTSPSSPVVRSASLASIRT